MCESGLQTYTSAANRRRPWHPNSWLVACTSSLPAYCCISVLTVVCLQPLVVSQLNEAKGYDAWLALLKSVENRVYGLHLDRVGQVDFNKITEEIQLQLAMMVRSSAARLPGLFAQWVCCVCVLCVCVCVRVALVTGRNGQVAGL